MTTSEHNPERDAAAYLGADLPPGAREAFETHMLGCDACWSEVSEARTGRALAEGLREAAPQDLRERLRAIAASIPEPAGTAPADLGAAGRAGGRMRFTRILTAAAAVAALGVAALVLVPGPEDPEATTLVAAASVFQTAPVDTAPTQAGPPVPRIGAMAWQGTVAQPVAGQATLVHRYADAAGHRVVLMSSTTQFPRALGAEPIDAMGKDWIATVDGVQMLCVDHDGLSWLVLSDSRDQALAAGREAGLV